ncbi:MAG: hypothetical protein SFY81_01510 [Verrucomicrobiota bacterium]|nr:hypothetical protein [Verrucomicrobiota bacterium]
MKSKFQKFCFLTALLAFALPLDAADVSGIWKWSYTTPDGRTMEPVMTLHQEGSKLSGSIKRADGNESPITEGKIDGNKISFVVVRERDGNTIKTSYSGEIDGDTLKGKTEFSRDGETRSRQWEAKRAGANSNLTGTWKSTFTRPDGESMELKVVLKQEGNKVTGTSSWNNIAEAPIQEGNFSDNKLKFTVKRERDGKTITSVYEGTLEAGKIKGKITSDWSGENRTMDWEAKRE